VSYLGLTGRLAGKWVVVQTGSFLCLDPPTCVVSTESENLWRTYCSWQDLL